MGGYPPTFLNQSLAATFKANIIIQQPGDLIRSGQVEGIGLTSIGRQYEIRSKEVQLWLTPLNHDKWSKSNIPHMKVWALLFTLV